ncbi:hypothetical protein THRCLA_03310 [Thraustotheca clavata]|uniref:Rho GTPase-activating protein n=1 Tax=Thraustotheca clavata TaxID=74557 RepID=A0A1W0A2G2_9STRA|nr:hypothetical protein THRCLA_03310 [Thraustotheca clavata]
MASESEEEVMGNELKGKEVGRSRASMASASSNQLHRRASSKRWYSESDEEEMSNNVPNDKKNNAQINERPGIERGNSEPVVTKAPPPPALDLTPKRKMSGIEKLVQKTKLLSPFRLNSKKMEEVETQSTPRVSRRQSRLIENIVGSPPSATGSQAPEDDAEDSFKESIGVLSPGRGQLGGAAPGPPGSGVLLEGWLRQKQRRGIRGLKKWNSRYFVLYAKVHELRYYSDVVQSGWGPIPLGEIGSISLRLIQRISKPSHPKYKGCRFDITCRSSSSGVPDLDDDPLSSDDEAKKASPKQPPKIKTTPKASRVYSLIADSPQTTVLWVNTLDSLLTRSVNSPRPDGVSQAKSQQPLKALAQLNQSRQKSAVDFMVNNKSQPPSATSTLTKTNEWSVFSLPDDIVPKAIVYAIEYIFESSPGIETELFYEKESPPAQLKAVLTRLNQCGVEKKKPTRNDWDTLFDVVSASGVVILWLHQLEGPIVPTEMFADFAAVIEQAAVAPFEMQRNLKGLLSALPPKPFKIIAYLIFHWNDVTVYQQKNQMTAKVLAERFSQFVFRSKQATEKDKEIAQRLLEEMITHADALIDEKESEILDM